LKRNVLFQCSCQGCNARLKIEFISEPVRTGAMWTVDCPVCGTSKMIPDDPVKIYYQKDGEWIEARPKSQHFKTGLSRTNLGEQGIGSQPVSSDCFLN